MRWYATDPFTLIDKDELSELAADQAAISADEEIFDNTDGNWLYGLFELDIEFAAAADEGGYVELYLIPAIDGSTYADGTAGASPVTVASQCVGQFPVRANADAQRITLGLDDLITLPPCKFKAQLVNKAGQALEDSGDHASYLKMLPYRMKWYGD